MREINRRVQQYGAYTIIAKNWDVMNDEQRNKILDKEAAEVLIEQVLLTADSLVKQHYVPYAIKFLLKKPPPTRRYFDPYPTLGWRFNAVYGGSNWGYVCESLKQWWEGFWTGVWRSIKRKYKREEA